MLQRHLIPDHRLKLESSRLGQGFAWLRCTGIFIAALVCVVPASAKLKSKSKDAQDYGGGLTVSVPASQPELLQAVQDVVADGIIQGSKEYNKDEYIGGAEAADSTKVFPRWTGPGQVFYKIKRNALDPRNFKDGGDSGTLAVRYVVIPGDEKNTILKLEAIYVDDFHHRDHLSNGSVEGAEYKDIQDHLATAQLKKQQATDDEQRRQSELAAQEQERERKQAELEAKLAIAPNETLEQHIHRLREDVERLVKAPGAQLKSAPFKSSTTLTSVPAGTQVVILISTPYWYGVETQDGQHGWLHRSQVEQLP